MHAEIVVGYRAVHPVDSQLQKNPELIDLMQANTAKGRRWGPPGPEPSFFLIIYNSRLAARPPNEASDKNGGGFGRRHSVTVF